jgi:hypothetical protein
LPVPHDNIQDERYSIGLVSGNNFCICLYTLILISTICVGNFPNDGSDQNYLNLVTTAMKSDEVSRLKLPTQIVDINIKVYKQMQKLLPETKPIEYRSSSDLNNFGLNHHLDNSTTWTF